MPDLLSKRIFISYSRKDADVMRNIAFFLRDQGFKVWVDNEKLIPGTPAWEEGIEKAINNAIALVVILSPEAKDSEWVRREIAYADQYDKGIFPVIVGGNPESSLPIRLITRQYIDFRKGEEAGLNALKDALLLYIDKKETLEMKRPAGRKKSVTETDPGTKTLVIPKKQKASKSWIIPAVLIMVICLFGAGAAWAGYRIFSSSPSGDPQEETKTEYEEPAVVEPESMIEEAPKSLTDIPYLLDTQITHIETFDDLSEDDWGILNGEIIEGVLQISGNENNEGVWRKKDFEAGEGVIVDFRFSDFSTFQAYLSFGSYGDSSHRRIGVYIENGSLLPDLYEGEDFIFREYSGNLSLKADTTYSILLAILPDGEVFEFIWNPEQPNQTIEYRETFGDSWNGLPWTFVIQAGKGEIQFDDFREVTFNDAE